MSDTRTVRIVAIDTGETADTFHAASQREAEQLDRGININLNHDEYYTVIE